MRAIVTEVASLVAGICLRTSNVLLTLLPFHARRGRARSRLGTNEAATWPLRAPRLRGDFGLQRRLGEPADAGCGGEPAFLHEFKVFWIKPSLYALAISCRCLTTIVPGCQGRIARA